MVINVDPCETKPFAHVPRNPVWLSATTGPVGETQVTFRSGANWQWWWTVSYYAPQWWNEEQTKPVLHVMKEWRTPRGKISRRMWAYRTVTPKFRAWFNSQFETAPIPAEAEVPE